MAFEIKLLNAWRSIILSQNISIVGPFMTNLIFLSSASSSKYSNNSFISLFTATTSLDHYS